MEITLLQSSSPLPEKPKASLAPDSAGDFAVCSGHFFSCCPCPVYCLPESNIDSGGLWVEGKDTFWEAGWPSGLTPQFQRSQHAWVHAELAMMRMFACRIGASLLLALGILWPRASPCGISTHIEIGECSNNLLKGLEPVMASCGDPGEERVLVAGLGCVCMCGPSPGMASQ